MLFFFIQAEDGIRDLTVTGVQTCALPIWGAVDADGLAAREPVGGAVRVGEQVEDPIDRRGDDAREGDGGGAHGGLQPTRMWGKGVWGFSGHGTSRAWGSGEVVEVGRLDPQLAR